MGKKMKGRWKRIMVWCMVMVLMCANCTFQSEAKTSSKVKVSKTAITSVKSKTAGQATVTFKKQKKASGYQVQISTDKKFKKSVKTLKVSAKKKTATFKKLKQGRKYYARVRVYRTVEKKRYYSSWSKVKSVTTKKKKTTNKISIKSSKYMAELETDDIYYTGEARCPRVAVFYKTSSYNQYYGYKGYLQEGEDYKVSYKNNVEIGTATITITGIGNYCGSITKKFTIKKGKWNGTVKFKKTKWKVGEKLTFDFSKKPEKMGEIKEYDPYARENPYSTSIYKEECLGKDKNGNTICKRAGEAIVYLILPETKHYYKTEIPVGKIWINNNTDPIGGFRLYSYSSADTLKTSVEEVTIKQDKKATVYAYFDSEADVNWVKKHMSFKAVDVTPKEYKKALVWAGWNVDAPTVKVATADTGYGYYGTLDTNITTPVSKTEGINWAESPSMTTSSIAITMGEGVRVCRVDAYKDGVLYDSVYMATKPYDEDGNYLDEELYKKTRRYVESKIWTKGMTNFQKLDALANYISSTAHYPGSGCTKKEVNPTLWKKLSVDGKMLYYNMFDMPTLNRVMALHGGTITCLAVDIVERAAVEDLGMKNLYSKDKETGEDIIAKGEGVWLARGSFSSNPYSGGHESLIYKDANEKRIFIDAQGMLSNVSCEEHGCLDKVIQD